MTMLAASYKHTGFSGRKPALFYRFLTMLCVGCGIGTIVALGLYVTKTVYVGLLPLALAVALPPLVIKNFRLYWFAVFLVSLQFTIAKNLNDGMVVIDNLMIDYTIWDFTFQITATDLVLFILLSIWVNDSLFKRKPMRFPRVIWLAVGYLGICLLSLIDAPSPYLGLVEMSRQIKFFIVYLYAVNCLTSKNALRVLAIAGVAILVTQAAVSITRFETGNLSPLTFGDSYQDNSKSQEYLSIDREAEGSAVRGFGTLASPGSTVRLCMMVIPFALFLSVPNAMFKARFIFAALAAFGVGGLILTFTRVYYITTAVQLLLAFSMMIRGHMLKRQEIALIIILGVGALAAASQKLYDQFTVREDSVSVRFLQYEATAKMILDNPFLGVGLNNGTSVKRKYSTLTYNKYDPDTQFDQEPTHNMYLNLASEIGIVGTVLFVTFFAQGAFLAWRASYLSRDAEIRLVASALVVAFSGVAVNGLMDPLGEYPVLILLWMFAGISQNLAKIASYPEIPN